MSELAPVSFTVRRPSPVSRASSSGPELDGPTFKAPALPRHLSNGPRAGSSPLARSAAASPQPKPQSRTFNERDSSDEEDEATDELVTGFDQFGVQRLNAKKKPEGPLVIVPLQNKDWRETAKKRRTTERFVPSSAGVGTGADGSVGGLGTRDSINSGPQLVGLQLGTKRVKLEHDVGSMDVDSPLATPGEDPTKKEEEEDEDKRALRALLAGEDGENVELEAIPMLPARTLSEAEALRQDVAELPDSSSLADYDRIPVSQFGAAMLRGMGWKEDMAASRNGRSGKGNVQPWLPEQRPALLGIGAKEREVLDDGNPKKKKNGKQDLRYVPILKKEREGTSRGSEAEGSAREVASTSRDRNSNLHDRDTYRGSRNYDDRDESGRRSERDRNSDREKGDGRRSERQDRGRDHSKDYDDRRKRDDRYRDERQDRNRDYDRRRDDRGDDSRSSRRKDERRDRGRDYRDDDRESSRRRDKDYSR